MIEDASSSLTLEKISKKHKAPFTHTQSSKNVSMGKVEGSIEVHVWEFLAWIIYFLET